MTGLLPWEVNTFQLAKRSPLDDRTVFGLGKKDQRARSEIPSSPFGNLTEIVVSVTFSETHVVYGDRVRA